MKKVFKRLRFILQLRRFIPFLKDFVSSREVSGFKKWLSVAMIFGYLIFPFDLIPDFLLFFGILDDLTLLTFILQYIVKIAPPSLKEKYQLYE